jgi:Zn-dependent protease with chaperone function
MPKEMGPVGWGIALATLCFMVALSWRLWIHILSWLRVLKRPPERLQRIVSETTRRLHVPVRNVWLLTAPVSYAAALPLSRELIFSNRLVDLHPDEEIAVICAHELGHLAESRSVLAGRLIGSLTLFPWVFARPAFHAWQVGGIFYLLIATVLLWIFTQRLSRRMEVCADRFAHLHQREEGIYARALEKLYETNQMPAVMPDDRQMHPHLYDRMLAAGITPEYPRPLAPASRSSQRIVMVTVLVILIVWRLVQEDWITF